MFRDFSENGKKTLLDYVTDVTDKNVWSKIKTQISCTDAAAQKWINQLGIYSSVNQLDAYQQEVIDKKESVSFQIEDIFTKVNQIDTEYEAVLEKEKSNLKAAVELIRHLAETIDPSGGNLDIKKRASVLQADVDKLRNNQTTAQKEVEKKMYGEQEESTSMSVDPVNLSTGNYIYEHSDLSLSGEIGLDFHRYYNSKSTSIGTLGKGFTHNYEIKLNIDKTNVEVELEDGQCIHFRKEENQYVAIDTANEILQEKDGQFKLCYLSGYCLMFDDKNRLNRREDRNGNGINYFYDEENYLIKVETDYQESLSFVYNTDKLIDTVIDQTGRKVQFFYEDAKLIKAVLPNGRSFLYEYDKMGRIKEINKPMQNQSALVKNEYDNNYRVTKQQFVDGSSMSFVYDDLNKTVTQIERNGVKTIYTHDDKMRNTQIEYEDGTTEKFLYNEKNQCILYTDRLGSTQRMSYDNRGNLVQKIDAVKRRFNMTYDIHNNLLCFSVNGKKVAQNHYDKNGNLLYCEKNNSTSSLLSVDSKGRVTTISYADHSTDELCYDERGNVTKLKDVAGAVFSYEYNSLNQIIRAIGPMGNEAFFEYNLDGQIVKETNSLGESRKYTYSEEGFLVSICDYNGTITSRTYNELNELESFTDELGFETKMTYDSMWNLAKETFPNGASRKYIYDRENNLSKMIDGEGVITTFEYDLNGACILESIGDSKIQYAYDKVSRLTKVINPSKGETYYKYDIYDNIISISDSLNNYVNIEYDEDNRLIREENNFGEIRTYTYNSMDKISKICDEFGNETKYFYIPGAERIEKIEYADGAKETFAYDLNKNLVSHIDRTESTMTYQYDVLDRVISFAVNGVIQKEFTYDQVDNITKMVDGEGNVTQYFYSPRNELVKALNPDGSYAEYTYSKTGYLTKSTIYDAAGTILTENICERNKSDQITLIKDITGLCETYKYNEYGQLSEKIDKEGYATKYRYTKQGSVSHIGYADGREINLSYNAFEHLEKMQDWTGVTEIINDGIGRALQVKYPNGKQISYAFNSAGNRTKVEYPDNKTVLYQYDALQRLTAIKDAKDTYQYFYGNKGELNKKVLPNGVETTYAYDRAGLITSICSRDENGILDEFNLSYDGYGRKKILTQTRRGDDVHNGSYEYSYDAFGRMDSVLYNHSRYHQYEFDSIGNIRTFSDFDKNTVTNFEYNQRNQLIKRICNNEKEEYKYDQRGNLTTITAQGKETYQYVYGALNRLEKATNHKGVSTHYSYNGIGHKIGESIKDPMKQEQKIEYLLDMTRQYDNMLAKESNQNNTTFVWDMTNVIGMSQEGRMDYFTHDDMGSSIRMMNTSGRITQIYGYDEYGRDLIKPQDQRNPFGFTNYQRDDIANLYYAQAREYAPNLGRFVARDVIKGKNDSILSQNEYLYCGGDPKNYEDRNGQFVQILIGAGVGALAGGIIDAASQGIKMAQGKQEHFKWGECLGSAAQGAIVGGIDAACPIAGFVMNSLASGAGAVAKSTIQQLMDNKNHKVNMAKVTEDGLVGVATGGVFHGIGKVAKSLKPEVAKTAEKTIEKETVKTLESSYKNYNLALKGMKNMFRSSVKGDIVQENKLGFAFMYTMLKDERKKCTNKLILAQFKKKFIGEDGLKTALKGNGIIGKSAYTFFGIKNTKTLFSDTAKEASPLYRENGEKSASESLKEYFDSLFGKTSKILSTNSSKCPLIV